MSSSFVNPGPEERDPAADDYVSDDEEGTEYSGYTDSLSSSQFLTTSPGLLSGPNPYTTTSAATTTGDGASSSPNHRHHRRDSGGGDEDDGGEETRSAASSLPNESLTAIFEHLSPHSLTRVILVSHRCRALAERILYSSIIISETTTLISLPPAHESSRDNPPQQSQSLTETATPSVPRRTLRVCETLSTYGHLAEIVRRFHIRWNTDAVKNPQYLLVIAQNIIKTLLPTFVHLESLELSLGLSEILPLASVAHIFPDPSTGAGLFTLPFLRHLFLSGLGAPPTSLLTNHPSLQHFRLLSYPHPLPALPSTCLSNLQSFRGHPSTAASLLPGRSVETLSLVGYDVIAEDVLKAMAGGRSQVRTLDVSSVPVTPKSLVELARWFSGVRSLKVKLALRHTLHFALSGIRLLTALTTVLSFFPELAKLDLSPTASVPGFSSQSNTSASRSSSPGPSTSSSFSTSTGSYSAYTGPMPSGSAATSRSGSSGTNANNISEEERLCRDWARVCPGLREVVFPSKNEWRLRIDDLAVDGAWNVRTPREVGGGS